MIKFNKVFNSKIISLILVIVFLFTNITYGIDIPERSHLRKPLDFNGPNVPPRYICKLLADTYHNGLDQKLSPKQAFARVEEALKRVMEKMDKRNAEKLGIKVAAFEGGVRISREKDNIDIIANDDGTFGAGQSELVKLTLDRVNASAVAWPEIAAMINQGNQGSRNIVEMLRQRYSHLKFVRAELSVKDILEKEGAKLIIRLNLDDPTVKAIAESEKPTLPVLVVKKDGKYIVLDGSHRIAAAARKTGAYKIDALGRPKINLALLGDEVKIKAYFAVYEEHGIDEKTNQGLGMQETLQLPSTHGPVELDGGRLQELKRHIFDEIDRSIYGDAVSLNGRIEAYEDFVLSQAKRLGIRVENNTPGIFEYNKEMIKSLAESLRYLSSELMKGNLKRASRTLATVITFTGCILLQIISPMSLDKYKTNGEQDSIMWSGKGRILYPTNIAVLVGMWLVLGAEDWFAISFLVLDVVIWVVLNYIQFEGHELSHVYQDIVVERARQELVGNRMSSEAFAKLMSTASRQRPIDTYPVPLLREPPSKERLKAIVEVIFEELTKYASLAKQGQGLDLGVSATSVMEPLERQPSPASALIGKYELLTNPVFDEASGTIRFTGKSIDTGRIEEITLNASRAPPETIDKIKQILSALLKTDNNAINKVLAWFDSSFTGQILLLEDNTQNIFGLGASGLIAINKSFSNNPIALLHEIAELAINAGIITTEEIVSSLQDRTWYDTHIAKGNRENLRPHYALRALQREVFKWADRDLTTKIRVNQQSIEELFESLSSGIIKWFNMSSRVNILFKQLLPQERANLLARILRDDYNLKALQSYAIITIATGQKRSAWEDVLGDLVLDNPEDLPYIVLLLMDPNMSEEARSYLWNAVEYIAIKYPLEAVKALHAAGFESEKLVDMAMAHNAPNRNAERIVLNLLISVNPEASKIAQRYAALILSFAEQSLRNNQPFNASLVENALTLLEPTLASDKKALPWRTLAETKDRYINQLFIINDIFQEALRLISENPDITYEELYRRLIVGGPGQENFNRLTKKQRVLVKSALIRSRADRLKWKSEFEEARKSYPIDELNAVSSEIMELYKTREEFLRLKDVKASIILHQIMQRISVLKLRLASLRREVAPLLEEKFDIPVKDVPEIVIIRLGNFGLELYIDSESLQKAFRPREDAVAEKDFFGSRFGFSKQMDITMLRRILRKFPLYVFGDFQDEMVAYLTSAQLRSWDFDEMLDTYMDRYLGILLQYIKRQDWFKEFVKVNAIPEGTLEGLMDEVRSGPEWQKTRQALKGVKKLLDELVDIKATLLYYEMKLENPELNTEELTAKAYKQASNYMLGIFQLIPILKADDRLKGVLARLNKELEEKGINKEDILRLPIKKREPRKDGAPTLWAGFQRGVVIVSDIEGGIRVVDHEGQHLIFGLYTGREAITYTRDTSHFYRFMGRALSAVESNISSLYEDEDMSDYAQIGKHAQLESVERDIAKVKDSKGNTHALKLTPQGTIDISLLKSQIEAMQDIGQTYKELILTILSLLEESPPLYAFDTLIEDLFGFARPEYNMIALHQDFITNPVALFHEIGEYLIRSGILNINLINNNLIITSNGKEIRTIQLSEETLKFIQEENWSDKWQKNNHYLLRVLQREIFGQKDRDLTQRMRQLQTIARNIFWPILTDEEKENSKKRLALINELLPEIIEQVIPEYKDKIEAIYLIGSFLFKRPFTDLDLVVIVRDNVGRISIPIKLPKEISQRLGFNIVDFFCDIKILGKDILTESTQSENLRYLSGVYKSGILLKGSDLLIEPQNSTLVDLAKDLSSPHLMSLKGSYLAMAILITQQIAGILKDVPIERIREYLKQGILYYYAKSMEEYEEIFRIKNEIAGFDIDNLDLVRGLPEVIEQVPTEDEKIAKIILNGVGKDIENIRDPNNLCGWIANFTFNDTSVDPYKVLEFILEEFDQMQYLDIYKEVLGIKISKAQKMRRPPLLELIERDWDVIDTTNLEELLSSLKPSRETRKIELEEVEMSPLGHGVLSSHSPEELGDLKDGMRMINKWVEERRIMGEGRVFDPFIIHGIEIPLDGRPVIMDVDNRSFIIKAFKDRVVIEAQGTYSVYSLFEGVYIRSGFSGIAALGGREFMFYREGNKVILKPLHEILQIHRIIANSLTVNGAFGIRKAEKGLYRADSGFRDLLIYSDPEDIPRLMNKYFKWLEKEEYRIQENSPEALHPVELAAQAFCKLLWIHPFENGNTRTAGLVMNYILMKNGFPPFMLNAANERRFYELERFMDMPLKEEFSKSEHKNYRIVDRDKIFSFTSDEYTAFLSSQIASQIAPNAMPGTVVEENTMLVKLESVSTEEIAQQIRRKLEAPIERGTGWIRISATPGEAYEFHLNWSSQAPGYYVTQIKQYSYIMPIRVWQKMAAWSEKTPDFERKGYFVAHKINDDMYEILDFIPNGTIVTDPTLDPANDEYSTQRSLNFFEPIDREVARELNLELGLEFQDRLNFEAITKERQDLISIPFHSHHQDSVYSTSPSSTDRQTAKEEVNFVYCLGTKKGYFYDNDNLVEAPQVSVWEESLGVMRSIFQRNILSSSI